MSDMPCSVDGCEKMAEASGLCCGHRKRRVRKQAVSVELRGRHGALSRNADDSAWDRLTEAALAYADADAMDEVSWARARDNLRKAAHAYMDEKIEAKHAAEAAALLNEGSEG